MNQILHYIQKDLRQLRWPLLLFAICVLANIAVIVLYFSPDMETVMRFQKLRDSSILPALTSIVGLHLLVVLLQSDLTFDPRSYWLTKPIPSSVMLTGKLLQYAILLALYLSPLLVELSILESGPRLFATVVKGAVMIALFISLQVAWLAVFTGSQGRFYAFAGGLLIFSIIVSMISAFLLMGGTPVAGGVMGTRAVLCLVLCLLGPLASLAWLFLQRRFIPALRLGMGAYALALLTAFFWPFNLTTSPAPDSTEFANIQSEPVKGTKVVQSSSSVSGIEYVNLIQFMDIATLEASWYPVITSSDAQLSREDGQTMDLYLNKESTRYSGFSPLGTKAVAQNILPGYKAIGDRDTQGTQVDLGKILLSDMIPWYGKKLSLKGRLSGRLYQYRVLAELPPVEGKRVISNGVMVRIMRQTEKDSSKFVVQVVGNRPNGIREDAIKIVLADPETKQMYAPRDISLSSMDYFGATWFNQKMEVSVEPGSLRNTSFTPRRLYALEPVLQKKFSSEISIPDFTLDKFK